jgi:hypothetical protein
MTMPKFRIIACEEGEETLYYLQRKRLLGWKTLSGFHAGHAGGYAYQYISASNPYYLIEHMIPEVISEMNWPRLSSRTKATFGFLVPVRRFDICGVVDIERTEAVLREYKKAHLCSYNPYPKGEIVWSWQKKEEV